MRIEPQRHPTSLMIGRLREKPLVMDRVSLTRQRNELVRAFSPDLANGRAEVF